jgi:hypothetical protein
MADEPDVARLNRALLMDPKLLLEFQGDPVAVTRSFGVSLTAEQEANLLNWGTVQRELEELLAILEGPGVFSIF